MQAYKVNPKDPELFQGVDQLAKAERKPVVAIHHDGVHEPLAAVGQKAIQGRPMLLRAADPGVYILADNLPVPALTKDVLRDSGRCEC